MTEESYEKRKILRRRLRMTSAGVTLPFRRHAVYVVPVLIGGISRLCLAVVIPRGIGKAGIRRTNTDLSPFLRRAGIVNGCQARAV